MNLAQIRSATRETLTAGGAINTNINIDTFWVDKEVNYYINNAYRQVYRILRMTRADWFQRILQSTDSPLLLLGRTFNPATLKILSGISSYVLPPDFVAMKLLSSTSARFTHLDLTKQRFRSVLNAPNSRSEDYFYDIIGLKTLFVRPVPKEDHETQIIYDKAIGNLVDYSVGSVTSIIGTQVTFSGTTLTSFVGAGDEFIIGSAASGAPLVDPSIDYPVIKTIDSNTTLTLDGPWLGGIVTAGSGFLCSQVPELPVNFHDVIIHLAVKLACSKGPNPHTELAGLHGSIAESVLRQVIDQLEARQLSDIETSEPYLEGELY